MPLLAIYYFSIRPYSLWPIADVDRSAVVSCLVAYKIPIIMENTAHV